MYTSKEFSKQLKEAGCEFKSEMYWNRYINGEIVLLNYNNIDNNEEAYPSYDILNDICIKYAKEFFGEEIMHDINTKTNEKGEFARLDLSFWVYYPRKILDMLQQNKPQEEIEKYIWDNCKFNKLNQ